DDRAPRQRPPSPPLGIRLRFPRRLLRHGRLPGLLGRPRRWQAAPRLHQHARTRHGCDHRVRVAETIVIGAGPAGIRAARPLAEAGLKSIVLDEQARAGGQIYRRPPSGFRRSARTLYGFEARKAEALHRDFDALGPRIDYRPNTLAWSIEGGR